MTLAGLNTRYDQEISLGKMYKITLLERSYPFVHLQPFLAIEGTGTLNVYYSQIQHANKTGMISETITSGYKGFEMLPNFIYIEEATDGVTSIILNGVTATEV